MLSVTSSFADRERSDNRVDDYSERLENPTSKFLTLGYEWLLSQAQGSGHWGDIKRTSLACETLDAVFENKHYVLQKEYRWLCSLPPWLFQARRWLVFMQEAPSGALGWYNEELWDTNQALIALSLIGNGLDQAAGQGHSPQDKRYTANWRIRRSELDSDNTRARTACERSWMWIYSRYSAEGGHNWEGDSWETAWSLRSLSYAPMAYGDSLCSALLNGLKWLAEELVEQGDSSPETEPKISVDPNITIFKRPIEDLDIKERAYQNVLKSLFILAATRTLRRKLIPDKSLEKAVTNAVLRHTKDLVTFFTKRRSSENDALYTESGEIWMNGAMLWGIAEAAKYFDEVQPSNQVNQHNSGDSPALLISFLKDVPNVTEIINWFVRQTAWGDLRFKITDSCYILLGVTAFWRAVSAIGMGHGWNEAGERVRSKLAKSGRISYPLQLKVKFTQYDPVFKTFSLNFNFAQLRGRTYRKAILVVSSILILALTIMAAILLSNSPYSGTVSLFATIAGLLISVGLSVSAYFSDKR